MPYQELDLGAAGYVLMYRLRFHQRRSGKTFGALSAAMDDLGRPLSAQRIGQVLNGKRRLSTDELTALATTLGVPASSLVLDTASPSGSALAAEVKELTDEALDADLRQLVLERDGYETQLYQSFNSDWRANGVEEPATILARLEAHSIRIEVLEVEADRRARERRIAEIQVIIADQERADRHIDELTLSGALGDKPGDKPYEVAKRRQTAREKKEASDGKR